MKVIDLNETQVSAPRVVWELPEADRADLPMGKDRSADRTQRQTTYAIRLACASKVTKPAEA